MFLLDESLFRLWQDGLCEKEECLIRSAKPAELAAKIAQVEKGTYQEEDYEEEESEDEEELEDEEAEDEEAEDEDDKRLLPARPTARYFSRNPRGARGHEEST